jgi:cytochrome c2
MRIATFLLVGIALISLAFRGAEPKYPPSNLADSTGAKLFRNYCSACHKDSVWDSRRFYAQIHDPFHYASLKSGKMKQQGFCTHDAQQKILQNGSRVTPLKPAFHFPIRRIPNSL